MGEEGRLQKAIDICYLSRGGGSNVFNVNLLTRVTWQMMYFSSVKARLQPELIIFANPNDKRETITCWWPQSFLIPRDWKSSPNVHCCCRVIRRVPHSDSHWLSLTITAFSLAVFPSEYPERILWNIAFGRIFNPRCIHTLLQFID